MPLSASDVAAFSLVLGALSTVVFGYPIFWRKRHRLFPHVPTVPGLQPFFLPLWFSRTLFVIEIGALSLFYLTLVFCQSETIRPQLLSACVLVHFLWIFFWLLIDEFVQTPQLVFLTLGLLSVIQPQLQLWDLKLTFTLMYFHGGLQKMNKCFFNQWPNFFNALPQFLLNRKDIRIEDHITLPVQHALGCLIASSELLLGISLILSIHPLLTNAAVLALICMHIGILATLGPHISFHAAGVWPWNLACLFCLPAVFWMTDPPSAVPPVGIYDVLTNGNFIAVSFWAGIFPIFGYFDCGYPQLSWVMYSYNTSDADIYLDASFDLPDIAYYDNLRILKERYIDYSMLTRLYHITPITSRNGNIKLAAWIARHLGVGTIVRYTHRADSRTGARRRSTFEFPA